MDTQVMTRDLPVDDDTVTTYRTALRCRRLTPATRWQMNWTRVASPPMRWR